MQKESSETGYQTGDVFRSPSKAIIAFTSFLSKCNIVVNLNMRYFEDDDSVMANHIRERTFDHKYINMLLLVATCISYLIAFFHETQCT